MPDRPAPPLNPRRVGGLGVGGPPGLPAGRAGPLGYALWLAQCGEHHPAAKPLKGTLRGLVEIVADADRRTST